MKSEFGVIGLGVMGKSLSRNLSRNGFRLSLYNRHVDGEEENVAKDFLQEYDNEFTDCRAFDQLPEFVASLKKPRRILLMIKAGEATDLQLEELGSYLNPGDIVMDGGNAHYRDTKRRMDTLSKQGIGYLGAGISGGEEGALNGPSIMPGGAREAYDGVREYLEAISAKDPDGDPCCTYIGPGGAGHFVKMVHNGIEYGEMQLIAETYSLLRAGMGKNPDQVSALFSDWARTGLDSYLLDITATILQRKENGTWIIDTILDKAGNKGTGSWATMAAAELGVPLSTISESLFARFLSFFKEERVKAEEAYGDSYRQPEIAPGQLKKAYELSRIINHHQGFHLIFAASEEYGWNLDLADIARIWTSGCIIQSELIKTLPEILSDSPLILQHPGIRETVSAGRDEWGDTVAEALKAGFYIPAMSSALNYLNGFTSGEGDASIIQAQRDYFGAHRYQRKDDPSGPFFHTNWNE